MAATDLAFMFAERRPGQADPVLMLHPVAIAEAKLPAQTPFGSNFVEYVHRGVACANILAASAPSLLDQECCLIKMLLSPEPTRRLFKLERRLLYVCLALPEVEHIAGKPQICK